VQKYLRMPTVQSSPRQILGSSLSRSACVTETGSSAPDFAGQPARSVSLRKRSVGSVTSVLALSSVSRPPVSAFTPSPKSTLLGVFQKLRRAARANRLQRISERLASSGKARAPLFKASVSRFTRVSLN
jgi:hypothetical protein